MGTAGEWSVKPMVSIITVTHNGADYTVASLNSLRKRGLPRDAEVIVVDNGSSPPESQQLESELPWCRHVRLSENKGFGSANNAGATQATGEYLFFVNNDTLFSGDVVTPLAEALIREPGIGIVAPSLLNEDGTFQISFGRFPSIINERRTRREALRLRTKGILPTRAPRPDWVTGAALMIRRDLFRKVGGFDEGYFMYFEDVDLCKRVRLDGSGILYREDLTLTHLGGKSYVKGSPVMELEYRRSQLRFYDKFNSWPERLMLRLYLLLKALASGILFRGAISAQLVQLVFRSQGT